MYSGHSDEGLLEPFGWVLFPECGVTVEFLMSPKTVAFCGQTLGRIPALQFQSIRICGRSSPALGWHAVSWKSCTECSDGIAQGFEASPLNYVDKRVSVEIKKLVCDRK